MSSIGTLKDVAVYFVRMYSVEHQDSLEFSWESLPTLCDVECIEAPTWFINKARMSRTSSQAQGLVHVCMGGFD